jgi:hypothetical protein
MKIKLKCRLFGHDFRNLAYEGAYGSYVIPSPSEHCRNCGLSKREIKEIEGKNDRLY